MIKRRRSDPRNRSAVHGINGPSHDYGGGRAVEDLVIGPISRNGVHQAEPAVKDRSWTDEEVSTQSPIGGGCHTGGVGVGNGHGPERLRVGAKRNLAAATKDHRVTGKGRPA